MKTKVIIFVGGAFFLFSIGLAGTAYGQVTDGQFVLHMGAAYAKTTEKNAGSGFVGFDLYAGKMLTNSLCVGFGVGYDIVSYNSEGGLKERLAIIPFQAKVLYFINLSQMMQLYVSLGGGAYRAIPHLSREAQSEDWKIGDIAYTTTQPGGSVGIGLDYWFLLVNGVGFAFEYHLFSTDSENFFTYFTARVDYTLIRF
ncbi:MAG: hypothetical protein JSV33_15365 [bacterium]|nr:MAG: hypothetical protein JSV33_15365 [bacterium]